MASAESLKKDLIYLLLQYLDEEKFHETRHMLERESGMFLDIKYLEELVIAGNWDETEKYLSGFTGITDNGFSVKIFFEIRKQKYLEALDRKDHTEAVHILANDLKVFSTYNDNLYNEITQLITLDNFRQIPVLSNHPNAQEARVILFTKLKELIISSPVLIRKTEFPEIEKARLRVLVNQSLNWQHLLCANSRVNPTIITLFRDHRCESFDDPRANYLLGYSNYMIGNAFPNHPTAALASTSALSPGRNGASCSTSQDAALVFQGPGSSRAPTTTIPSNADLVVQGPGSSRAPTRRSLPSDAALGFQGPGSSRAPTTSLPSDAALGVQGPGSSRAPTTSLPRSSDIMVPRQKSSASNATYELPKILVQTLNQGSTTTTMDFHPMRRTILVVGTSQGDITVWEVSNGQKLVTRSFQLWNAEAVSETLKAVLPEDSAVVVKRVLWCNDYLLGVAYSKNMVQLFNYIGGDNIQNFLEIEAHNGSVNDTAFSTSNMKPCLITCGDDKTVKIWEVASGIRLYSFEGHEAPVYSVCPKNFEENICFVISTSTNGKINAWHVTEGSTNEFNAPGGSCVKMAYSADATRLFSGGTNSERESHIVEYNESDLTVKKTYQGLQNGSLDVLQFDTTNNKFLACGDAFSVKFWDMNIPDLIADIFADEELAARPHVRFNPDGSLLAVTATHFKVKILATHRGVQLISDPPMALQVDARGNQDAERKPSMDELARLCEINSPKRVRSPKPSHPRGFSPKKI